MSLWPYVSIAVGVALLTYVVCAVIRAARQERRAYRRRLLALYRAGVPKEEGC